MRSVVSVLLAIFTQMFAAGGGTPCDIPAQNGRAEVSLPLHPFIVATPKRSCALLVTLSDDGNPPKGGIAVLEPVEGKLALKFVLDLPTEPIGMAITKDESIVAVPGASRIYFVDLGALLASKADAILGNCRYDEKAGAVSLAFSPDEKVLFASDEAAGIVTMIDFEAAQRSHFTSAPVLGRIKVDWAPTMLKLTPDGKHLLFPVEAVRRQFNPPISCTEQPGGDPVNPVGAILSIDIGDARARPASVSPKRSYAGCSPVRLELTKDGKTAFVTNREENVLRVMDVEKILRGELNATITTVALGPSPIGVALVDDDRLAVVSNSNRWAKEQTPQSITLLDIAGDHRQHPVVVGQIPVGVFPRDIAMSRDRRSIFVSNFGSKSLTILDVSKLRTLASSAGSH